MQPAQAYLCGAVRSFHACLLNVVVGLLPLVNMQMGDTRLRHYVCFYAAGARDALGTPSRADPSDPSTLLAAAVAAAVEQISPLVLAHPHQQSIATMAFGYVRKLKDFTANTSTAAGTELHAVKRFFGQVARAARLPVLYAHTLEVRIAVAEIAAGTFALERAVDMATSLGKVVAAARRLLECA